MTPQDLAELERQERVAWDTLHALCNGKKRWTIPDLVFADALRGMDVLIAAARSALPSEELVASCGETGHLYTCVGCGGYLPEVEVAK